MKNRTDVRVVLIRFLPYDCPEYADSYGWLEQSFNTNREAYQWCNDKLAYIEDAYFIGNGDYIMRDGCSVDRA